MPTTPRPPRNDADLRKWLENMVWYHHLSDEEISDATGLALVAIQAARARYAIDVNNRPARPDGLPLLVLPYPGGRHPRIGFLDGALDPQRETKVSVFTPWDPFSYVVVDVPEAIFSNLGLTYLAHTHVPTIWTQQKIDLPPLEWKPLLEGGKEVGLELERELPNKISFGTRVRPEKSGVRMEMWLTNGTPAPLTGLRVQVCVMFRGCSGFEHQTNDNKVLQAPYAAARNDKGNRWVITGWDPLHRVWANPPCPCMHSDPLFPDCPPGETRRLRGWLSFYEGTEIQAEIKRIDGLGWKGTS